MDDDRIPKLEDRVTRLEVDHSRTKDHLITLDTDIKEIRNVLGNTATKDDIADLRLLIEKSLNERLRDALNAVPAKQAVLWSIITIIMTLLAAFFGFFHFRVQIVSPVQAMIHHSSFVLDTYMTYF